MVLSNEVCEQGKECKDKDCIKGHISPAAVNPALGMYLFLTYTLGSDSKYSSRAPVKYADSSSSLDDSAFNPNP